MKIALLFPGYSSQFVGMGKELYDEYRVVQEYFEEASNCLDKNFVKLCFASSDVELARAENAYPAIFLLEGAIWGLLKELQVVPDVIAGYNQGKYAAFHAGGCFSFPDGLYLLSKASSFYQEFLEEANVSMLAVKGIAQRELETKIEEINSVEQIVIAIVNGAQDFIVSGYTGGIDELQQKLSSATEAKTEYVNPEMLLRSSIINPVIEQYKVYLEKVDFKDLQIPCISTIDGSFIDKGDIVKKYVTESMNHSLYWVNVMQALAPFDLVIESGPGSKLTEMVKAMYPKKRCLSINKIADVELLKQMLKDDARSTKGISEHGNG